MVVFVCASGDDAVINAAKGFLQNQIDSFDRPTASEARSATISKTEG